VGLAPRDHGHGAARPRALSVSWLDDLARPADGPEALQQRLGDLVARGRLPSLSLVLVSSAGLRWTGHFGPADDSQAPPLRDESVWRWYSLTKPVSASLVMLLVQQGLLSLSTRARDVLPLFAQALGAATVEDLLSHRAGLRDWQVDAAHWFRGPEDAWPDPREALGAVLGGRGRHRVRESRRGGMARYSNLGYAVLGEIAAEVAGQPYRQLVSERLLAPLGMSGTGFALDRLTAGHGEPVAGHLKPMGSMGLALRLRGADSFLGQRRGPWRRTLPREIIFSPHGGLVGPAGDLAPFLAMHLGSAGSAEAASVAPALLTADSRVEMRRPRGNRKGSSSETTGLGWMLTQAQCEGQSVDICRHGGRGPGFSTEMMVVPELGVALAALMNVDEDVQGLCRALLRHGPSLLQAMAQLSS
jgi:CubicO group peptidase (beta-lactamase class C family)